MTVCNRDLFLLRAGLIQSVDLATVLLAALSCQLVEDLPIDLYAFDTCVFDHESFLDGLRLGNDGWDGQSGWNGVVVEAYLVRWHTNWATADGDANWEFDITKPFDFRCDYVVKFAADIVVYGHRYRNFRVWWQISTVWVEDDGQALVVAQIEALVFLQLLCFGECLTYC